MLFGIGFKKLCLTKFVSSFGSVRFLNGREAESFEKVRKEFKSVNGKDMFFLNVEDPRFSEMPLKSRNNLVLSFFPEDSRKNIIVETHCPSAKNDREVKPIYWSDVVAKPLNKPTTPQEFFDQAVYFYDQGYGASALASAWHSASAQFRNFLIHKDAYTNSHFMKRKIVYYLNRFVSERKISREWRLLETSHSYSYDDNEETDALNIAADYLLASMTFSNYIYDLHTKNCFEREELFRSFDPENLIEYMWIPFSINEGTTTTKDNKEDGATTNKEVKIFGPKVFQRIVVLVKEEILSLKEVKQWTNVKMTDSQFEKWFKFVTENEAKKRFVVWICKLFKWP
uniref:Uncharacterized protein n=1 Tax=Meloidogyne incognita TaxID=6306 RepID=A0A914M3B2_MELIC